MSRIKIVLAEDHHLVRAAFKVLLGGEANLEVIGEAQDGIEAVEICEKLKPHILLLDLRLPRMHGLDVIKRLRPIKETKIIVVTMHADEAYLIESVRSGVRGFILKDSPPKELMSAIKSVMAGHDYISESLQAKALEISIRQFKPKVATHVVQEISRRERAVLELAAEGKSNAEIGAALFISRLTAEAHRCSINRKLGFKTQADLVLYAVRHGIVTP